MCHVFSWTVDGKTNVSREEKKSYGYDFCVVAAAAVPGPK